MDVFQKNSAIFNLLSEGVSEGIIVVNTQHEIVFINSAAEAMFGHQKEILMGKPLNFIIPKRYHERHENHVTVFIEKNHKRQMGQGRDLSGLRKNGEEFPVEAGLSPFELDGNSYVMALVTDITERKDYTQKLEQTVQLRTKQLTDALAKEKELNELKSRFMSLISHELKTPLSGILSSSTLLSKYTDTDQQEKRDKHIKNINSKVRQLNAILNDFLAVEHLETGKLNYELQVFALSNLLHEVVNDANLLLKKGQNIQLPDNVDELEITFDRKILALALSNVLNNAIKYSPEGSTIEILFNREKDFLVLKVIDHGIGIPAFEQKKIFQRYFRAENTLLIEGTGIGLNIVKQHLHNLGATLSFESQECVGSTFNIRIPKSIKNLK